MQTFAGKRRRIMAGSVAVGLTAAGLVVAQWSMGTGPASATTTDRPTGSFNMQGQFQGSPDGPEVESRWRSTVIPIIVAGSPADAGDQHVLALQEAGSAPPPSAAWTDRRFPRPGVTEHLWNIRTADRPDIVNIYWTDTGQQRNGLAIVTRETARDAVTLTVNSRFNSRPMMGVQLGTDWYFTAHASSRGGQANDAEDIIETARQFMARRPPGEDWMVLADFNSNPVNLPARFQQHIVRTGAATHQGGHELDWAYLARAAAVLTLRAVRYWLTSDHYYVRYEACRTRAQGVCGSVEAGATYVLHSYHIDGKDMVLAHSDNPRYSPRLREYKKGDKSQHWQILFGAAPDTFTLGWEDDEAWRSMCLTYGDNRTVVTDKCLPFLVNFQWMLNTDSLIRPARWTGYRLQPESKADGAKLSLGTGMWQWRLEKVEGSGSDDSGGDTNNHLRDLKGKLRVMPLGDSITAGVESSSGAGYRAPLYESLHRATGGVEFVGSMRSGRAGDPHHEGHPGWTIDQIEKIAACSVPSNRPNVVLLHAGTNDVNQNLNLVMASERLEKAIDTIHRGSPHALILVAKIIPTGKTNLQPRIDALNEQIPRMVAGRANKGYKVRVVDMDQAITVADGVQGDAHPNDAGYAKIAKVWFAAIAKAAKDGLISTPTNGTGQTCSADSIGGIGADRPVGLGDGWRTVGVIAPGMGGPAGHIDLVELNGDKRADYVKVLSDGSVRAALNNKGAKAGFPDWQDLGMVAPGVKGFTGSDVRFADVNGDSRDDYLLVSEKGGVKAYLNGGVKGGKIEWTGWGVIVPGVGATRDTIRWGDVDGNGRDDYLVVGAAGSMDAYLNTSGKDGKPTWTKKDGFAKGVPSGSREKLRIADVNGDGKADYLIVGGKGAVHAYLNHYDGKAANYTEVKLFANESSYDGDLVTFRDFSDDGKADYVVVYQAGAIRGWINAGGNTGGVGSVTETPADRVEWLCGRWKTVNFRGQSVETTDGALTSVPLINNKWVLSLITGSNRPADQGGMNLYVDFDPDAGMDDVPNDIQVRDGSRVLGTIRSENCLMRGVFTIPALPWK
jgi:lysophospholipase L1-like esterase